MAIPSRNASALRRRSSSVFPAPALLQRKCGCGAHKPGGGTCGTCAAKQGALQRSPANQNEPAFAPQSVHDVLSSAGRPLDAQTREFFEPRFGRSFENVRIHSDEHAANSAREVGALAYAVGSDIVFGSGQFAPHTAGGRQTMAHELSHVAQQGSAGIQRKAAPGALAIGQASDAAEHDADRTADAVLGMSEASIERGTSRRGASVVAPPILRRKLVISPTASVPAKGGGKATPLTTAAQGLLQDICPSGGIKVDAKTGVVSTRERLCEWHPPIVTGKAEADISSTPTGCRCICDVVNSAKTTTVDFRAGAPATQPTKAIGSGADDPTINADPRFQGQYQIDGKWVDIPFHLIFAHELCGHALPLMGGTQVAPAAGPAGGTPPHERAAVDAERAIAAEHNPPLPRRPEDYGGAARQKP